MPRPSRSVVSSPSKYASFNVEDFIQVIVRGHECCDVSPVQSYDERTDGAQDGQLQLGTICKLRPSQLVGKHSSDIASANFPYPELVVVRRSA